MGKCSTLLYLNDNLNYPSEKIIQIDALMDDMDQTLEGFFRGKEIEVDAQLVSKTMTLVDNMG
ncbi:MAG TPA: hypothetical protein VIH57_26160 [Bacteroidales bacterium]|jgi:hypothetical protein